MRVLICVCVFFRLCVPHCLFSYMCVEITDVCWREPKPGPVSLACGQSHRGMSTFHPQERDAGKMLWELCSFNVYLCTAVPGRLTLITNCTAVVVAVCCLLDVPATCKVYLRDPLLRYLHVQPH